MRTTQILGALGTAAVMMVGSGCGNVSGTSETASSPTSTTPAASASATPTPATSPIGTATSGVGADTGDAGDTSAGELAAALPPPPAPGTDAAVAWEGLMSTDGEYAASASYAAVIDAFGQVEPYVSIRQAEERHIAALTRQLERLGVTVPANPYLGNVTAPAHLQSAAEAWATGEVDNVAMYDALLTQTADANLTKVLTTCAGHRWRAICPCSRRPRPMGGR